jgi:CRP/FNR family transcriptional regulator, cyclic AMP receptor protein
VERLTLGPMLSSASDDLKAAIRSAAVRTVLSEGKVLFRQGEPGSAFYVIERGEIEISVHSADGRKLALDVLRDGEVFGEIALFGGRRTATASALSDSLLQRVRRTDLLEALRRDPELALDFIEVLCERLRRLSCKLEERAFQPIPARLASRLLYLDAKFGNTGHVGFSQAELADFIGATREGVAKTLAVWRSRRWVALSRRSVQILERAALEEIEAAHRA